MNTLREPDSASSAVESFQYQEVDGVPSPVTQTLPPGQTRPPGKSARLETKELDRLLSEAHAKGLRDGSTQAKQQFDSDLEKEKDRIARALQDFESQRSAYYSRIETTLVHLSLAISSKILHREAQVDRMLVAGLAKVALERVRQGTSVTISVHPQESAEWAHYFHENAIAGLAVEVKSDPKVELHNCVLQTELGSTELGLEAQLKEIEQGFFDLLAQRPEAK